MADLNLRNVPDELMVELKQAAAAVGWTLKEECLKRLSGKARAIERPKAKRPKMIMAKPERQEPMKVEPPKVETSRPSHAETCRCGICQLRRK